MDKIIMDKEQQREILDLVQNWFRTVIVPNHIENTKKLIDPDIFNINPFLAPYLAGFLDGELTPDSVAKALLYPRILGTSITTSFGQNIRKFISDVFKNSFGSMVAGVDIEFIDSIDGRRKYCQAKLGPNTINKDDIVTIHNHFKAAKNLGRTNSVAVQHGDLVVGVLYGEQGQESNHYQKLRDEYDYPLYIGQEFWHRLTGNPDFYKDLKLAIADVAVEAKGSEIITEVINTLAKTDTIRELAGKNNSKLPR